MSKSEARHPFYNADDSQISISSPDHQLQTHLIVCFVSIWMSNIKLSMPKTTILTSCPPCQPIYPAIPPISVLDNIVSSAQAKTLDSFLSLKLRIQSATHL